MARVHTYPVARVFVRAGFPHPSIATRARDAHARAAKQRRTAPRSARTRYYESRGPSSGENNGQPFRDNDELALHLARVYVYHHAASPPPRFSCRSLSLPLSLFLFRFRVTLRRLFRAHWRFCTPRLFCFHRSAVNDRCVHRPSTVLTPRHDAVKLICITCRDTLNGYSESISCTFLCI